MYLMVLFHAIDIFFVFEIDSISEPYSVVYAADTLYCTVPTTLSPQHEALLEGTAALTDHDPSTCMELFANGKSLFQISADYPLRQTTSFSMSFAGVGVGCKELVTIYFEKSRDGCFSSEKRECAFIEEATTSTSPTSTECMFHCYSPTPLNGAVRVTLRVSSPNWAPDSHKLSHLCDFKLQ